MALRGSGVGIIGLGVFTRWCERPGVRWVRQRWISTSNGSALWCDGDPARQTLARAANEPASDKIILARKQGVERRSNEARSMNSDQQVGDGTAKPAPPKEQRKPSAMYQRHRPSALALAFNRSAP